jgi:hypothetical protein
MQSWWRHSVWLNRVALAVATLLFAQIGLRNLVDPVAGVGQHAITLGSPAGMTVARVGFGGFPLAVALFLVACLVSTRRHLAGLGLLATIAIVITGVRLLGIALDGPAPFTLRVLKPEIVLVLLSSTALALERRRRQRRVTPEPAAPSSLHD